MTGNAIDFGAGGRSGGTAYGGDSQSTTSGNTTRNDYQFNRQRHQNHPESTAEQQRRGEKYTFDTVVVGGVKPRGGQGRTSSLGSVGGETEARRGGINEIGDGHQGHVGDMAAISDDMQPVNMAGQGYTLGSGEMNMDDDIGDGTGRDGSDDALSGGTEGTRGVLKMGMDEGQVQTSTWSETKTKVCSIYLTPKYSRS